MKFNKHGIAHILPDFAYQFTGIWAQEDTDLILSILDDEDLI